MKYNVFPILALSFSLMLVSCGSKKAVVDNSADLKDTKTVKTENKAVDNSLAFVQKVSDRQVYAKNIVGSMSFNIKGAGKDITLPASLHMRKDKVIRIQLLLPLLGSEVGRLEFTPDYVLVVDRIHKEYVKANYGQVDFLSKQGLTFYSLQAMFWNQLFLPGKSSVSESDLKNFAVNMQATGNYYPVSYAKNGMNYVWSANRNNGRIDAAKITYTSKAYGTSVLNWKYGNFVNVGSKQFPGVQGFNLQTTVNKKKQTVEINLEMNNVKTDEKWEAETTLSAKYKKVAPEEVLGKLMNMQ